jgi:hypothetical protein
MSSHCSDHDVIDDQQILICFKPTAPDQGLKDVTRLCNLLHYSNTKLWDKLTGGGDSRFFAKDLKKQPRIYDYVMKKLQDYIMLSQTVLSFTLCEVCMAPYWGPRGASFLSEQWHHGVIIFSNSE